MIIIIIIIIIIIATVATATIFFSRISCNAHVIHGRFAPGLHHSEHTERHCPEKSQIFRNCGSRVADCTMPPTASS